MENVRKVAEKLGVLPRLKLGIKIVKADGKPGGIKSTGPHIVNFLSEPKLVMGKDFEGKERQELQFEVEEHGFKLRWNVPIKDKNGNPSYLVERLMNVEVGDTRVLEMMKRGAINYVDIRMEDEAPDEPPADVEAEDEEQPPQNA